MAENSNHEKTQAGPGSGGRRRSGRLKELAQKVLDLAEDRLESAPELEELIFSTLLETSADSISISDLQGRIIWIDQEGAALLGYKSADELVGQGGFDMIAPEAREQAMRHMSKIQEQGRLKRVETVMLRRDGSPIQVEMDSSLLKHPNGTPVALLTIIKDISGRKRVEEELRTSEERLKILFEYAPDGYYLMDLKGAFVDGNRKAEELSGYARNELIGKNFLELDLLSQDQLPKTIENLKLNLEGKPTGPDEHVFKRKDGSLIPLEVTTFPVNIQGQDLILGIARDVSKRKRAEEMLEGYRQQLRSLASELTLSEQRERRRIAVELHDQVGQILAASKIKLSLFRQQFSGRDMDESLAELHGLIERAIKFTRALTFELSPPVLYELGFEAAVEWLAEQHAILYGTPVEFTDDGQEKPLADDVRVFVFQAVRELLVNIAKHARAEKIKVEVALVEGMLQVTVEDDGVGFNSHEVEKGEGFGLFNIGERLSLSGGRLDLDSEPERGARVVLSAPIDPAGRGRMEGGGEE